MAEYHLNVQTGARGSRKRGLPPSALAKANYVLRHDVYEQHPDVVLHAESGHMPVWAQEDPLAFWKAADGYERANGRLYREIIFALPVELTLEQHKELVREFVPQASAGHKLPYTFAIHAGYGRNPHCHLMLNEREHDGLERTAERWFRRANSADPARGGAPKVATLERKSWLLHCREQAAEVANTILAREGHEGRVDHRSYEERDIDLIPGCKRWSPRQGDVGQRLASEVERQEARRDDDIRHENGERIAADPSIALRTLTEHNAAFSRDQLLRFLNKHTQDAEQFQRCFNAVLACPELVELGAVDQRKEYFTTVEMVATEKALTAHAASLYAAREIGVKHRHVQNVLDEYARNGRALKDEQRAAMEHIVLNSGRMALVQGYAGTGKSFMLGAAAEAWKKSGSRVFGAALAGKAAEGLEEKGIHARTLDSWELAWAKGFAELRAGDVFVVDEASMIGTVQMERVLRHVRQAGAKIVLVGDSRQLAAIAAGSPFRHLSERFEKTVLIDIQRQKVEWMREAARQFALGEAKDALKQYVQKGHVIEHARQQDAREAMVESWWNHRVQAGANPGSDLMLAYRRSDVAALNTLARTRLQKEGKLRGSTVLVLDDGRKLEVAQGERLYFLKNDRELGVLNGSLGTLEGVEQKVGWTGTTQRMYVLLDSGKRIVVDPAAYGEIDYGYACTVHKAQGVTVDRTFVLASSLFDDSAAFVAMSRHEQHAELHYSREEFADRRQWGSMDLVQEHDSQERARQEILRHWATSRLDQQTRMLALSERDRTQLNQQAHELLREGGALLDLRPVAFGTGRSLELGVGERVRFELEGSPPTHGTVRGFEEDGASSSLRLELDGGEQRTLDPRSLSALQYAYAVDPREMGPRVAGTSLVLASAEAPDAATYVRIAERCEVAHVHYGLDQFERGSNSPEKIRERMLDCLARANPKQMALDLASQQGPKTVSPEQYASRYRWLNDEDRARMVHELTVLAHTSITQEDAMSRVPEYRIALAARLDAVRGGSTERVLARLRDRVEKVAATPEAQRKAELLVQRQHERSQGAVAALRGIEELKSSERRRAELGAWVAEARKESMGMGKHYRLPLASDRGKHFVLERLAHSENLTLGVMVGEDGTRVVRDLTGHKSPNWLRPGDLVLYHEKGALMPVPEPSLDQQRMHLHVVQSLVRETEPNDPHTKQRTIDSMRMEQKADRGHCFVVQGLYRNGEGVTAGLMRDEGPVVVSFQKANKSLESIELGDLVRYDERGTLAPVAQPTQEQRALQQRTLQRMVRDQKTRRVPEPFPIYDEQGELVPAAQPSTQRQTLEPMQVHMGLVFELAAAEGHPSKANIERHSGRAFELADQGQMFVLERFVQSGERAIGRLAGRGGSRVVCDLTDYQQLEGLKRGAMYAWTEGELIPFDGHEKEHRSIRQDLQKDLVRESLQATEARLRRGVERAEGAESFERFLATDTAVAAGLRGVDHARDAKASFVLRGVGKLRGGRVAVLESDLGDLVAMNVTTHDKAMQGLQVGDPVRLSEQGRWLERTVPPVTPELEAKARALEARAEGPRHTEKSAHWLLPELQPLRVHLKRAEQWRAGAERALAQLDAQPARFDRQALVAQGAEAQRQLGAVARAVRVIRDDPANRERAMERLAAERAARAELQREARRLRARLSWPEREAAITRFLHHHNRGQADGPNAFRLAQDHQGALTFVRVAELQGGAVKVAMLRDAQGRFFVHDASRSHSLIRLEQGREVNVLRRGRGVRLEASEPSRNQGLER